MATKAPGKAYRKGLSLVELMGMFPTEDAAREWFESVFWPEGRCCGHCGSTNTKAASHKYMPYWCSDCRSYFSVKTGTVMQASKLPLRKWAIGIYHLPDFAQVGFVDETPARPQHRPESRMVHAASHPRSVVGRTRRR